ncbi:MAG TPA: hypothetical protein VLA77_02630 [Candidatus Saccharimonadales bacterium]|nr:hypothetical protein [Candidatus Saccharimonadales bacterium]
MEKRKFSMGGMFCFSPPVMIATFFIEIILALAVIWKYKLNPISRLVVLILLFLAIFQVAEFMICEAWGFGSLAWSRVGHVAITMLPPLGIHLAYEIAGAKKRALLLPAYLTAGAFVVFFLFVGGSLETAACLGNYVIFEMAKSAVWLYVLYYYGWLFATIWLCNKLIEQTKKVKTKHALYGLAAGYAAFILPTATVNLIDPSTVAGIPSIMCGFAVLLALALVFWVLPKSQAKA